MLKYFQSKKFKSEKLKSIGLGDEYYVCKEFYKKRIEYPIKQYYSMVKILIGFF